MRGLRRLFGRAAIAGVTTVAVTVGVVSAATVFTDEVVWPNHTVSSAARARVADVQIAEPNSTPNGPICPTSPSPYSDVGDGIVPFQVNDMRSSQHVQQWVCVRNQGARYTRLSAQVTDIQSVEGDCTGDESLVDPTCGNGQAGELEKTLGFVVTPLTEGCVEGFPSFVNPKEAAPGTDGTLEILAGAPQPLGVELKPGLMTCVLLDLQQFGNDDLAEASQSDYVSFNLKFATTTEGATPLPT